jgi:hypothetical protein
VIKGSRQAVIATMAAVTWIGTFGVSTAEPLFRARAAGISVVATFNDETQGYLRVAASRVTLDGVEQVLLDVVNIDFVTETISCGSALVPAAVLQVARQGIVLHANLSALDWLTECEEGSGGAPSGVVDLSFNADGAFRTTTMGTQHQWLPTYVVHSTGTSEDESAQVHGQMLNAIAPGQSIQGQVSRFSSRVISIERR